MRYEELKEIMEKLKIDCLYHISAEKLALNQELTNVDFSLTPQKYGKFYSYAIIPQEKSVAIINKTAGGIVSNVIIRNIVFPNELSRGIVDATFMNDFIYAKRLKLFKMEGEYFSVKKRNLPDYITNFKESKILHLGNYVFQVFGHPQTAQLLTFDKQEMTGADFNVFIEKEKIILGFTHRTERVLLKTPFHNNTKRKFYDFRDRLNSNGRKGNGNFYRIEIPDEAIVEIRTDSFIPDKFTIVEILKIE